MDEQETSTSAMNEQEPTTSTQKWKVNETLSRKEGVRRSIYEITRKKKSVEDELESKKDEWEIGRTYTGEWSDDLRHGYGVQIWSNQCKYEGDWKQNQRNGHGVYWVPVQITKTDTNSSTTNQNDITSIYDKSSAELSNYTSKNVGNLLQVQAELANLNQGVNDKQNSSKSCPLHKQYEGEWRDDLKHGKGTFYHKNGDKFEGIFAENLRSGYGIMKYQNGDKYEGDWKSDQKNGFGIYLNNKENTIYTGYWMNDQKEGPGYFRFNQSNHRNDKLYVAEWVNNTAHCGYFVNINDVEIDLKSISAQKQLIPTLGLLNADSILSAEIKKIRRSRKLIRSLTIIDDLEDLFEDHEHDQALKLKIIDIFEQISVPLKQSQSADHERCYVEKENLFESIHDFKLPAQYDREDGADKLQLSVAAYCNDLGIGKSKSKSDGSNTVLIFTLLDYAKVIYLLLHN